MQKHVQLVMTLLLMSLIVGGALAQDDAMMETENTMRDIEIQLVDAIINDDGNIDITIDGTILDGCNLPIMSQVDVVPDQAIFISLYREMPLEPVFCTMALLPFQETFTIDISPMDSLIIAINRDATYRMNVAQIEPMPDAGMNPSMLTPMVRQDLQDLVITGEVVDDLLVYTVEGTHPNQCAEATLAQPMPATLSDGYDVYGVVGLDTTCLAEPEVVQVTVPTMITSDSPTSMRFNDQWLDFTLEDGFIGRNYHFIEIVDVLLLESFPMQLQLQITGYQSDGCEFPIVEAQYREGNTIEVYIYRNMPLDIMCPMNIVPYEQNITIDGGFYFGDVSIKVNDFETGVTIP